MRNTRRCFGRKCPVNCKVSAWAQWGLCNQHCGGGTQLRVRSVQRWPTLGGRNCPTLEQKRKCSMQPCGCRYATVLVKVSKRIPAKLRPLLGRYELQSHASSRGSGVYLRALKTSLALTSDQHASPGTPVFIHYMPHEGQWVLGPSMAGAPYWLVAHTTSKSGSIAPTQLGNSWVQPLTTGATAIQITASCAATTPPPTPVPPTPIPTFWEPLSTGSPTSAPSLAPVPMPTPPPVPGPTPAPTPLWASRGCAAVSISGVSAAGDAGIPAYAEDLNGVYRLYETGPFPVYRAHDLPRSQMHPSPSQMPWPPCSSRAKSRASGPRAVYGPRSSSSVRTILYDKLGPGVFYRPLLLPWKP